MKDLRLGAPFLFFPGTISLWQGERQLLSLSWPKPKGEERSAGSEGDRVFLRGLRPFQACYGNPLDWGEVSSGAEEISSLGH